MSDITSNQIMNLADDIAAWHRLTPNPTQTPDIQIDRADSVGLLEELANNVTAWEPITPSGYIPTFSLPIIIASSSPGRESPLSSSSSTTLLAPTSERLVSIDSLERAASNPLSVSAPASLASPLSSSVRRARRTSFPAGDYSVDAEAVVNTLVKQGRLNINQGPKLR